MQGDAMTITLNRPTQTAQLESRRPSFPIQQQSGSLFFGWGPKL
jgi:hypothetical protein